MVSLEDRPDSLDFIVEGCSRNVEPNAGLLDGESSFSEQITEFLLSGGEPVKGDRQVQFEIDLVKRMTAGLMH